jgi:hypothetical protein
LGDRFQVEYPIDADQAFLSSSFDSFFSAELVTQARRQKIEPHGPLIVGCDPAGINGDRIAIARRRGRCITSVEARHGLDTMQLSGLLAHVIKEEKPARMFIDIGGLGVGVYEAFGSNDYDAFRNAVIQSGTSASVELCRNRTVGSADCCAPPQRPQRRCQSRDSFNEGASSRCLPKTHGYVDLRWCNYKQGFASGGMGFRGQFAHRNPKPLMSALCQKRTLAMLDWSSNSTQNFRRWFPQGIKRERGACVLSIRAMPRLPPQL